MRADMAAIRSMGLPDGLDDLIAQTTREGQSAAPDYQRFKNVFQATQFQVTAAQETLQHTSTPLSLQSPKDALEQLEHIVGPLVVGSYKPRWTFDDSPKNPLPPEERYADPSYVETSGVPLLFAIAEGESQYGKPLRALAYLRAAESISHQIGQNPGQELTAVDLEKQVLDHYRILSSEHGGYVPLENAIASDMARLPPLPNLRHAYEVQYWQDLTSLRAVLDGPFQYPMTPVKRMQELWRRASTTQKDADHRLRLWRATFSALPEHAEDWQPVIHHVTEAQWDIANTGEPFHSDIPTAWLAEIKLRRDMRDGSWRSAPSSRIAVRSSSSFVIAARSPVTYAVKPGYLLHGSWLVLYNTAAPRHSTQNALFFPTPYIGVPQARTYLCVPVRDGSVYYLP